MDLQLKAKVALVTGGTVGIGLAVARGLAKEGVKVAICGRDGERAQREAAAIKADFGIDALGFSSDVSKAGAAEAAMAAVEQAFGGLDILINNAGTGSSETILEASDERWQQYWDEHQTFKAVRSKLQDGIYAQLPIPVRADEGFLVR